MATEEGHGGHDMEGMSGGAMGMMSDEQMTALKNAEGVEAEQALPDRHDHPPRGRNRYGADRDRGRSVPACAGAGAHDRKTQQEEIDTMKGILETL